MQKQNKFDRFDLEQSIMDTWGVTDDIDTLCKGILERDMTIDEITNALLGMKVMYHLKFLHMWDIFEDHVKVIDAGNKALTNQQSVYESVEVDFSNKEEVNW
jgi:hypothetical protein